MKPDDVKEFLQAIHNIEWSIFWCAVWLFFIACRK